MKWSKLINRNLSNISILAAIIFALVIRLNHFTNNSKNGYNATSWDALGYYMYLPATFIYKDVKELKWFPHIDSTYNVSGGQLYQATQLENGNFAFKYLGGVAIMQLPFFTLGHISAEFVGEKTDGFSWPYQYAIMWGAIFWFILGLFVLRKVLLVYYSEKVTALTILLIVFASNLMQYVSIEGSMSHSYIFPLYSLLLWWTIKWHENFKWKYALAIGFVIGLASISRPTELIMIFIPILWSLKGDISWKAKWKKIKSFYPQVGICLFGGLIGIAPQLIYWKYATGSWIYDVGSKWFFLNPWWRVLIGFEKGWFIYTPITIFMVVGIFFIKDKPFKRAIITFIILNIWIIISWSDWRYGASYSARAFTQSYPVFALALAAFINYFLSGKKKFLLLIGGTYLIFLNIIQLYQFNNYILHYNDMNAKYYSAIYLDLHPTPLDLSLLDTDELMSKESIGKFSKRSFNFNRDSLICSADQSCEIGVIKLQGENWMATKLNVFSTNGLFSGKFRISAFQNNKIIKQKQFRFILPFVGENKNSVFENHFRIPLKSDSLILKIESNNRIEIKNITVDCNLY